MKAIRAVLTSPGSISIPIALALALPREGDPSAPAIFSTLVPGMEMSVRSALVVLTFAVVLVSLTLRGLTMKPIMRHLGFFKISDVRRKYERRLGELVGVEAAVYQLEQMRKSREISADVYDVTKRMYTDQIENLANEISKLVAANDFLRKDEMKKARHSGLLVQRSAIEQMRSLGRIADSVAEDIIADIDERIVLLESSDESKLSEES